MPGARPGRGVRAGGQGVPLFQGVGESLAGEGGSRKHSEESRLVADGFLPGRGCDQDFLAFVADHLQAAEHELGFDDGRLARVGQGHGDLVGLLGLAQGGDAAEGDDRHSDPEGLLDVHSVLLFLTVLLDDDVAVERFAADLGAALADPGARRPAALEDRPSAGRLARDGFGGEAVGAGVRCKSRSSLKLQLPAR